MLNVDDMIRRILAFRQRTTRYAEINEAEIHELCAKIQKIFLSEPMILNLNAPVTIIGDLHGQFYDLLKILDMCGYPPDTKYLFLGDYVDRGEYSIEVICLIMAYKIKYPNNIYMLRGNHECADQNYFYGFFEECKRRYKIKLWRDFISVFDCMPACGIINGKIFCVHGGLSPELNSLQQILQLKRPTDIPDYGLLCDLLWSDPDTKIHGWKNNNLRGISYKFGADIVEKFLKKFHMELICRAHYCVKNGYKLFAKRKLVTIFSIPDYLDGINHGAAMVVDKNLECSFRIICSSKVKGNQDQNPQNN